MKILNLGILSILFISVAILTVQAAPKTLFYCCDPFKNICAGLVYEDNGTCQQACTGSGHCVPREVQV